MRNVVQLSLAANDILFMRKWNYAFSSLRSLLRESGKMANIHLKKQTNSVIEWLKNYWTRLSQNMVISQIDILQLS